MEFTLAEIFRFVAIFAGALIAFFTLRIYSLTKGGSEGWKYMAVGAVSLFLWATLQIIFSIVLDISIIRIITGIFFLPMIAVFITLSHIILVRDMKINRPFWFNKRVFTYCILALVIILLLYNFLTPFTAPLQELLSIAHLIVSLSFLFTILGTFLLWRGTGNHAWALLMASGVIIFIGLSLIAYSVECCGIGGIFHSSQECLGYHYDYVGVTMFVCNPSLISLSLNGSLLLLLAILLYCLAYYMLWKPMEYMRVNI